MTNRFLIVGFPKSAKTGALASLVDAGYTLRYQDFDGNAAPLFAYSKPENHHLIQMVECRDKTKVVGDKLVYDGTPAACSTALAALNKWPDGSKAFDWGENDILVTDSGSVMAESAMARNMSLNSREGKKPQYGDYEAGQQAIIRLCQHAKLLKCHFIMITHLFLMGPDLALPDTEDEELAEKILAKKVEGADSVPWKLAPKTIGKAIHDMAKHFTGVIYCKSTGPVRRLHLAPTDSVDAGVPIAGLPSFLDIKDGMAKIFAKSKE